MNKLGPFKVEGADEPFAWRRVWWHQPGCYRRLVGYVKRVSPRCLTVSNHCQLTEPEHVDWYALTPSAAVAFFVEALADQRYNEGRSGCASYGQLAGIATSTGAGAAALAERVAREIEQHLTNQREHVTMNT